MSDQGILYNSIFRNKDRGQWQIEYKEHWAGIEIIKLKPK